MPVKLEHRPFSLTKDFARSTSTSTFQLSNGCPGKPCANAARTTSSASSMFVQSSEFTRIVERIVLRRIMYPLGLLREACCVCHASTTVPQMDLIYFRNWRDPPRHQPAAIAKLGDERPPPLPGSEAATGRVGAGRQARRCFSADGGAGDRVSELADEVSDSLSEQQLRTQIFLCLPRSGMAELRKRFKLSSDTDRRYPTALAVSRNTNGRIGIMRGQQFRSLQPQFLIAEPQQNSRWCHGHDRTVPESSVDHICTLDETQAHDCARKSAFLRSPL